MRRLWVVAVLAVVAVAVTAVARTRDDPAPNLVEPVDRVVAEVCPVSSFACGTARR
jgi:hypothetical protein